MAKFIVTYPGLLGSSKVYGTLSEAERHRRDKRGRQGVITVEMSPNKYREMYRREVALIDSHAKALERAKHEANYQMQQLENEIHQLEQENKALKHRVEGLGEAVGRWRSKADGRPAPGNEILRVECIKRKNGWTALVHERVPDAPPDPMLWLEVMAALGDRAQFVDKLYYDTRGWVAVIKYRWR